MIVTIAAPPSARFAARWPSIQRAVSLAAIGRGFLRCGSRALRPPGAALLRLVTNASASPRMPPVWPTSRGIARTGLDDDHRMQEQPDVASVADHAKAALAARMAGEVEFRRILDRQHVAPMRRPRRMRGGGREHDLTRHRAIVQEAPEAFRPGPVAAEPSQTSAALAHESGQKIGPPFWSRSSPNRPKSIIPSIESPPANQSREPQ